MCFYLEIYSWPFSKERKCIFFTKFEKKNYVVRGLMQDIKQCLHSAVMFTAAQLDCFTFIIGQACSYEQLYGLWQEMCPMERQY